MTIAPTVLVVIRSDSYCKSLMIRCEHAKAPLILYKERSLVER